MHNLNVGLWTEEIRISDFWVCIECSVIFKRYAVLGWLRYSLLMQFAGMSKPFTLCHILAKEDFGVVWLALAESGRRLWGEGAEQILAP